MKIYWTLKQIPELKGLTWKQRRLAWDTCYVRRLEGLQWALEFLLASAFIVTISLALAVPFWSFRILGILSALFISIIRIRREQRVIEKLRPDFKEFVSRELPPCQLHDKAEGI